MRKYYYHRHGENHGPFTLEELAKEKIKGDTLVWFEGMSEWVSARNVKELELLVKRHHYVAAPPPVPQKKDTTPTPPVILAQSVPESSNKPNYRMNTILGLLIVAGIVFVIYFIALKNAQTSYNYSQSEPTTTSQIESEQNAENAEVVNIVKPVQETQEQKLLRLHGQIDNTWYQFLRVDVDPNYTVSPLGGIQNVYVTITNDSDYLISHLVYEVGYIKQNGDFWKSEEVIQHDIQPKSSIRVRVPDSHRGFRVNKPYIGFIAINNLNYKWIDPENESIYDRVVSLGLWQ
jgi:hypothetical protein